MAFFGADLDVRVKELQHHFKNQVRQRGGGNGIRTLGVIFRSRDNNGNNKLDIEEFTEALALFG